MKKIKKILGGIFGSPLVRGVVKTLPFGNFIYEAAENVKHARAGAETPHHKLSLFIQFVLLVLIVYAFVTKQLTVEQVLYYIDLGGLWDMAGSAPAVSDSLNTVLK
jgi:hypothetical protein